MIKKHLSMQTGQAPKDSKFTWIIYIAQPFIHGEYLMDVYEEKVLRYLN